MSSVHNQGGNTVSIGNRRPHQGARGWPGQAQIIAACLLVRNVVAVLGRSSGKTALWPFLVLEEAPTIKGPYSFAYCSPTLKGARREFKKALAVFRPLATGWSKVDLTITLPGMGLCSSITLNFWGLDEPDNLRGERVNRIVMDEVADVNIAVVMPALRWMLLGRRGKILYIGTPKRTGIGNAYFKAVYALGQDPEKVESKAYASFQCPSYCNPHLPDDEIEALIADCADPDEIDEEIHARFLASDGAFFTNIDAVLTEPFVPMVATASGWAPAGNDSPNLWLHPSLLDGSWTTPRRPVAGLDIGEARDATALPVIDTNTRRQMALLHLRAMPHPVQAPIIDYVLTRLGVTFCDYDNTGGHAKFIANALARNHEQRLTPRTWNNSSKARDLNAAKSLAYDDAPWQLFDLPLQRTELEVFQVTTHDRSLKQLRVPRYGAPPGLHDDVACALALIAPRVLFAPVLEDRAPPTKPPYRFSAYEVRKRTRLVKRVSPYSFDVP